MSARRCGVAAIAALAIAVVMIAASVVGAAPTAAAPDDDLPRFAVAGPGGFGLVSADGRSMLATHWVLETDFLSFLDADSPAPARDSFALRFAGARLDAVLERDFHAQLFINLADNRVAVLEGWIEARLARWARLRIGTFPFPITQERVTPAIALPFVSTSVAAMLLPARDTGIQLLGQLGDVATYQLAVVNGTFAGGPGGSDGDSAKDIVARVFVQPFATADVEPLRKLGIGVGASIGKHTGTPTNPQLPSLISYGGQVFFSYRPMLTATGRVERIAPHVTWGAGPFALYGDAVWTREHVAGTTVAARAASVIATAVVTGENAEPLGFVIPAHPFDPASGQLGAIALVAGAGDLSLDSSVFPALADPAAAMRGFRVLGGGINWYLSRGVAVLTSYGHQSFEAAPGGTPRRDEDTVIARLQLVL